MENEITQFIIQKVLDESSDFDLATDDDLLGSGLVSSMGIFRIISFIEESYGIKVPLQDMIIENFMTVDAITAYIRRQLN
jgi:acyl carrier protein